MERKTGWLMAEQAALEHPARMQALLGRSLWDADELRDEVRTYVLEALGDRDAVLVVDETGFVKKGAHSVGVARQYSGTAGRIENAQVGVFLSCASRYGQALIDRRPYLPEAWAGDGARRTKAGVPDAVTFATKPAPARDLVAAALDAGARCAFVLADALYGSASQLRRMLEERAQPYLLAVRSNHHLRVLDDWALVQTDPATMADDLPSGAWATHAQGGLGATALGQGINIRDPSTWRQQVDFGMDTVAKDGWRQWYGARDVGIGRWDGIGRGGRGSPVSSLDGPADQASKSLTSLSDQASEATKGLGTFGGGLDQFGARLEQASFGGSGSGGGGGGGFGGLFRGFGGAGSSAGDGIGMVASDSMALADVPMLFASGGYTGPGSKYQPAGIVHAGEYVFSAGATRRLGVDLLDSWHRSARGYADGGPVGIPVSMNVPLPANTNAASPSLTIHQAPLNVTPAGGVTPEQLYAAVQRGNAETMKNIARNLGPISSAYDRRYARGTG